MLRSRRILKAFGLAFVVALALAAIGAASANAFTWKIAGGKLKGGEEETLTVRLNAGSKLALRVKIGGTFFKFTSEEVVETVGTALFQDAGTGNAESEMILELKKLKVTEPAGCTVTEPIKTSVLAGAYELVGGTLYEKFVPKVAAQLATFEVKGCALAAKYELKGSAFGLVEPAKTELVEQPLTFSPAINTAAGGVLTVNGAGTELTAEVKTKLKGPKVGKVFGVE